MFKIVLNLSVLFFDEYKKKFLFKNKIDYYVLTIDFHTTVSTSMVLTSNQKDTTFVAAQQLQYGGCKENLSSIKCNYCSRALSLDKEYWTGHIENGKISMNASKLMEIFFLRKKTFV